MIHHPFGDAEVHQIASDWAVMVKATGGGGPEANQKLFVFQKTDDAWKIARYCFSTINPPRA